MSDLYEAVLDLPAGERERFLADACAEDGALRREVQSLLDQDDQDSPLDRPVWVPDALLAGDYNADSPQHMRLAAGTRLGPYEIQSAIGAGGMGEVYRGRDTRLDRAVAIKVLRPDVAADPAFRARFDREARTISQLDHPNICPLFDLGEHDGVAYLVMPLLDGESLLDRLRRGAVPLPDALRIATSLASALGYAHGHGVLHRDIKPQNVLLLADGRVLLLDFGVAKSQALETAEAEADTTPALTRFGQVFGTPEYMSPEQLSARVVDGRSDMFSLGILIYLVVTGTHPFRGATAAVTSAAILNRPTPSLPPALSDLDRVVQRMLQKHAADRYPTMADCLADLRALERGAVTPLPAVPAAASTTRGASRPSATRAKVAGLVGVAALAAVVVFTLVRDRDESPPAPSTPAPAAAPTVASLTFWLDVDPGAGGPLFQSIGNHVYASGSRFKVHLVSSEPGRLYVLSDGSPSPETPSGLTLVFARSVQPSATKEAAATTDWMRFAGGPGRDQMWLVWSAEAIPALEALKPELETRHLAAVSEVPAAETLRSTFSSAASQGRLSFEPGAARAAIAGTPRLAAHRLELQHD
jgi:hypothetical protein